MFTGLGYCLIFLAISNQSWSDDGCSTVDPLEVPVPDFWPWAKQKLVEEIGQNDQNDSQLISKFVDDMAKKDKMMEQELRMGKIVCQNVEKSKKNKWFLKMISFRRSKNMKPKMTDQNGEEQSGRLPSSSSSQNWLRTFSFRRLTSKSLNSGEVFRSYSMRLNPDKFGQLVNDEQHCKNERKMWVQLYKESKQLQREITAGKNDPNCIVAKFGAIKAQIYKLMDTVAAKFGITIKKEYDIKSENPEKYSKLATINKMAKLWMSRKMGKKEMEDMLAMMWRVLSEMENNLTSSTGNTHRRRIKRVDGKTIYGCLACWFSCCIIFWACACFNPGCVCYLGDD